MTILYWLCVGFGWVLLIGLFLDWEWVWIAMLPYCIGMFMWTVARDGRLERGRD